MPLLKSSSFDSHWHLIYFDPKDPTKAMTSEEGSGDSSHRHSVQVPEGLGAPVLLPFSDPGSGEEHTHEVANADIAVKEKSGKKLMTETEKAKTMTEVLELFRVANACEKDSLEEAQKATDYWKGDQWDSEDRRALETDGRPALTLNHVAPMLDLLSGYARQNRMDWKWSPVESSDNGTADLFNALSKHVAKRTNMETEEIDVFDEGIRSRSFFEVVPDFTRNPLGEVRISHFPSKNVRLLPHLKKDLSDCDGLFKIKDVSLAEAKATYPDLAKDFESLFAAGDMPPGSALTDVAPETKIVESPDKYGATVATEMVDPALYRDTVVDIGRKSIRLLEFERKEYRAAHFVLLTAEASAVEVDATTAAKAETLDPLVTTVDTRATRIRVTFSAGPFVIKDGFPFRPFKDEFSLVPFYAKKDEDEFWGKVRDVIDPQNEINKRHSQIMDILNKMCAYGYLYDEDTFETKDDARKFDASASTPGFRLRVKSTKNPPLKMEGAKLPSEILTMEQASIQLFHTISNVNTQALGQAAPSESGVSKQIQMRQAMVGNEFLFDNFVLAKRKVGRLAMGWVKKIYGPDRAARVVIARAAKSAKEEMPVLIGGQEIPAKPDEEQVTYWTEQISTLWSEADIMDYDLEVGEGMLSPTARQAAFAQWLDAAKTGVTVPPELLMEFSDLPEGQKRRYLALMKKMQEQQMQLDNRKIEAEMMKARGGAPMPAATLENQRAVLNGSQSGQQEQPQGQMPPQGLPRR
jgi:hypothetical protein